MNVPRKPQNTRGRAPRPTGMLAEVTGSRKPAKLIFAFGGSRIRPRLPYRGFLRCQVIDGFLEVVAQACACFSTTKPFDAMYVHYRKPIFMAGRDGAHPQKSYRNLKNLENRQKCSDFITLQESTTRTDSWFGKLRLGVR